MEDIIIDEGEDFGAVEILGAPGLWIGNKE